MMPGEQCQDGSTVASVETEDGDVIEIAIDRENGASRAVRWTCHDSVDT
jgi:hypothetical protein